METVQKYVKLEHFNAIIIFSEVLMHSDFKHLNPVSAGFCVVGVGRIDCFGESISLNLKSDPKDTQIATMQFFGYEASLDL